MASFPADRSARTICGALLLAAAPLGAQSAAESVPFTRAQADAGRQVYLRACASCHGTRLDDGVAVALTGAAFIRNWSSADRTLDDLHFITSTTMPRNAGGTLAPAEYLAVVAYVLERNGYAAGERPLPSDRQQLARVRLTSPPAAASDGRTPPPDFIRGDSGVVPRAAGPRHQDLLDAHSLGRDWLTHTRDYAGSRYSPLTQITSANAAQLRPACVLPVSEPGNFQTGPVVHDGIMYITTLYATMAVDAATCRQKWRHVWRPAAPEIRMVNRGVAIKDGRVIRGTTDGYLVALDRDDGRLLWARRLGDAALGETITMAPLAYDSLVFVGVAASELAVKGWVAAFRLDNGERVWRFNIVPAPGEPGSETWKQGSELPLGGGAVWTPLSLDAASELLFVAAANPAPDFPAELRGGTNLYTNALIALHLRTGKLAWYDQMVPNDAHDWDLTQVSPVYRTNVGGRERNLIATAGKDGMLRVVDRDSKARLFETPVTTISNAGAPVTTSGTHACPGVLGGVEWNGPTYHRTTNLLVVPAVDWCSRFFVAENVRFVPGQTYLGGRVVADSTWQGWITAVDASTGAVRWRYRSAAPVVGAVTSTAGGLILGGELTGDFLALDAATGAERYRFKTGGAVGGGIVTYEVAGTQYIAVASGRPSPYWSRVPLGQPTITIFSLPTPPR
ncbi:MAG: outer membrane protein assembly factor BamB family protein [Gemmatimonadaceae bacterium]